MRTLARNISSQYYQRLLASQMKEPVIKEMKQITAAFQNDKYEFIKNPSVLEFLKLPGNLSHTESQIEKAIIDNLHDFLLELGKGYAFVERQKLIRTDARDYFIDLVFYNSILKGNEQIFASKYKLYLPTEAELAAEIQRQKEIVQLQLEQGEEL